MLSENARFLRDDQVESFERKLNKADERSLHFEWEVALLNVFSKIGRVEHAKRLGAKNPDIYLTSFADPSRALIADVTTVSDSGLGPEGLVQAFDKRLRAELGKRKLQFAHFSKDFKRIAEGATIEDYFDEQLGEFLDEVARNPRAAASYTAEKVAFTMQYHPQQGSYKRSSPITSKKLLSRNPFYNALKGKLDQLKASDFTGPRGIILCDGGSDMFFFRQTDVLQYGSDDIIKDFLRRNSSISFVLTVWVERTADPTQTFKLYKVRAQLFPNNTFSEVEANIREGLANVERLFPIAVVTVDTALDSIRQGQGKAGWSFHYWNPVMNKERKQIKISARGLLQLLAGDLSQKDFIVDQGFESKEGANSMLMNPFLQHFRAGELIKEISLERSELDDDYVVITFMDKDPAVSLYEACKGEKEVHPASGEKI
jgi:hypothetical protein